MNSCIYNGEVTHTRFKPVKHFLKYKTFSLLIDLDEISQLSKSIGIFSHNKFNVFSFYDKDHGDRDGGSLKDWVLSNLSKFNIEGKISKIKILCYPRIFGYVFNPLSIFYCYDDSSELKAVLYEVKNTFNEQHTYVFSASSSSNLILHKCDKKFYVSPFMEMKTFYNFRLLNPGKILNIFIKQGDSQGALLTACQVGKKIEMSSRNLFFQFLKHPLMSFKVILAIHFEALRLWIKGVKLVKRKVKKRNNLSIES